MKAFNKQGRPSLWLIVALWLVVIWPGGPAWGDVQVIPETVRVGLIQNAPQVTFVLQGDYQLINKYTDQVIAGGGEGRWTVENVGGLCEIFRDEDYVGLFNGPIVIESVDAGVKAILSGTATLLQKGSLDGLAVQGAGDLTYLDANRTDNYVLAEDGQLKQLPRGGLSIVGLEEGGQVKHYRGNIEVRPGQNGLTVINKLPIEQYLYGVVPAEMPASFSAEALKAQAVVARSYLITQLGSYASYGFDVLDSQSNQVYKGYDGENPLTSVAVDATKGMVLVNHGQPVAAFFHSCSGGYIENSEDVWNDKLAFIRTKADPYDINNKYYNWQVTYSADELLALINQQLKRYMKSGEFTELVLINDLKELEWTSSGQRVKKLLIEGIDIEGNLQEYTVANADRVRIVLGLKSSLFTMQKEFASGEQPINIEEFEFLEEDTAAEEQESPEEQGLSSVTFNGSGWGHGLGMSQYGAAGMASQGYSFQEILQYYYTGVELIKF